MHGKYGSRESIVNQSINYSGMLEHNKIKNNGKAAFLIALDLERQPNNKINQAAHLLP